MMTLGNRLTELRKLGELSVTELGLLAGISRQLVQMIESGVRKNPVASTIARLAPVVGDDGSYLLGLGPKPTKRVVLAAVSKAKARENRDAA